MSKPSPFLPYLFLLRKYPYLVLITTAVLFPFSYFIQGWREFVTKILEFQKYGFPHKYKISIFYCMVETRRYYFSKSIKLNRLLCTFNIPFIDILQFATSNMIHILQVAYRTTSQIIGQEYCWRMSVANAQLRQRYSLWLY